MDMAGTPPELVDIRKFGAYQPRSWSKNRTTLKRAVCPSSHSELTPWGRQGKEPTVIPTRCGGQRTILSSAHTNQIFQKDAVVEVCSEVDRSPILLMDTNHDALAPKS